MEQTAKKKIAPLTLKKVNKRLLKIEKNVNEVNEKLDKLLSIWMHSSESLQEDKNKNNIDSTENSEINGLRAPTSLTNDAENSTPSSDNLPQDTVNQRELRTRQQVKNNNELVIDIDNNSTVEKATLRSKDKKESDLVNSLEHSSLEHESSREELQPEIENQRITRTRQKLKDSEVVVTDLDNTSCNDEISPHNDFMETSDVCDIFQNNHQDQQSSIEVHLDTHNQRETRTRRKNINDEKVAVDSEKASLDEKPLSPNKDDQKSDISNSSEINDKEKELLNTSYLKGKKRGRKRKIPLVEANTEDNGSKDDIKKTPKKIAKSTSLKCGKCSTSTDSYPSLAKFKEHVIREHGGIARPLGEPQEFASEEEVHALLKEAFSYKKQVSCYQCMQKKFTSFGGLKMHLLTCGKSKEECDEADMFLKIKRRKTLYRIAFSSLKRNRSDDMIMCCLCNKMSFKTYSQIIDHWKSCLQENQTCSLALKVKCQYCSFRTYKHCMPAHLSGKHRGIGSQPVPEDTKLDKRDDVQQFTPSGRVKRKAASKANKMVVQAFKDIDASIDGETFEETKDIDGVGDGDNLEDEEYNIASEIESQDIRKMYSDLKTGGGIDTGQLRFGCHRCKFKSQNRIKIEEHIIKKHSVQTLESLNEEEDSYDSEDEAPEEHYSMSEDEEEDYIKSNARTSSKKSKKSVLKSPGKEIGTKAPPLYHDKEMIKDELKFRESNFCEDGSLFPELNTNIDDWIRLEPSEAKKYVPISTEKSVSFCIKNINSVIENENSTRRLNCFDTHINSDRSSATFYTGGPIWTGDWCPLNSKSKQNYDVIALSVDMDFETETKLTPEVTGVSKCLPTNSLLQLWSCPLDISEPETAILNKPKMKLGLVHDFGKIWCLKWCPSGCETTKDGNISGSNLPRLGILAASCSDGSVRLISIPQLSYVTNEEEECVLYKVKMKSVITLCHNGINLKDKTLNPACLSISWFKSLGHRVIAGAYSDGNISIWDIETKSILLKTQGNAHMGPVIYPYMFFRAHLTGVKISLDLGTESLNDASKSVDKLKTSDNEDCFFPRYLATGSSDRVFAIWDLSDGVTAGSMGTIVPIRQFRRHLISNIAWMHNYPGHVSVAHDDIYAHANTRSAIVDVTSANFAELRKRDDERQLSCGQYSATCQNSAIFSQAFCPMKNVLASSTAAGDLIIHVGLNPYGRRGATFKNDKRMQHRRCPIYRTEIIHISSYRSLQFIDMPTDNLSENIPEEERSMQRKDELMPPEPIIPINQFPATQINYVKFSPNLNSVAWLFSGNQSGFGRIHLIESLLKQ